LKPGRRQFPRLWASVRQTASSGGPLSVTDLSFKLGRWRAGVGQKGTIEQPWVTVGNGSVAGAHERPLTGTQFFWLGAPTPPRGDRLLSLQPRRTNFSIPGIQIDPPLPVAASVSERLKAGLQKLNLHARNQSLHSVQIS
jgi:hypothetical protein